MQENKAYNPCKMVNCPSYTMGFVFTYKLVTFRGGG